MRKLSILFSLFALVLLPAALTSQAQAGSYSDSSPSINSPGETDLWVIRLATDFGVLQNNLEEMIMHPGVSDGTKIRLKLLEQALRDKVMKVVVAAQNGDRDTVHRYLPSIARTIQKQILVLTISEDVTREWAAARTKAQVSITNVAQLPSSVWGTVVAQIETDGDRIQNA
ncbi:MAG: hypothetical protein VCD33_03335 [Alphaproteobacteria bacterium]|jgi:hypothetical protein